MGATLAKLAVEDPSQGKGLRFELASATALDEIAAQVTRFSPAAVGLTGCGAAQLARRLDCKTTRVDEFEAWGAGAARLLGASLPADGRYLLVSLGTGTSVLLVEGDTVLRVGGTALGGGTLMGLAAAILQEVDFQELCSLAEQGSRARVDLMVSDIYDLGEIALPSDLTAASFAKLARGTNEPPARADLAAAIVGLVAENVALICNGLAVSSQARSIVFCGSTLRGNPALASVLTSLTQGIGHDAIVLQDGEFGGALGALELARQAHG